MSKYPKYGSVECCVKCGARECRFYGCPFDRKYGSVEIVSGGGDVRVDDWIEVTCHDCHYSWREACADAEDES